METIFNYVYTRKRFCIIHKLLIKASCDTGHDDTVHLKMVRHLQRQWRVSLFENAKPGT